MRQANVTRDGYDRIGGLHPFVAFAGVLLFDLLVVAAILLAATKTADVTEDVIAPGGEEWITF